jgi:hypothetical protein
MQSIHDCAEASQLELHVQGLPMAFRASFAMPGKPLISYRDLARSDRPSTSASRTPSSARDSGSPGAGSGTSPQHIRRSMSARHLTGSGVHLRRSARRCGPGGLDPANPLSEKVRTVWYQHGPIRAT